MDKYTPTLRAHLKLCEKILRARLQHLDKQPVGLLLRNNNMTHVRAMLTMVEELRWMAAHDPDKWWYGKEDEPF